MQYAYNNAFNLASESVNGADAISFTYDADGLLTATGSLMINRDADNGLLTGSALGNVTDGWMYNGFGEPIAYGASFDNNELLNIQYQRDKLGRITQKTESINGYADVYTYSYDIAGRLSDVTKNGTLTSHYDYDQNGNRLNNDAIYDAQDRMITYGSYSYTYTDNGELATRTDTSGTTEYGYDNYGNLTVVVMPGGKRIEYVIDGQNRRVGRKVNGALVQGFVYENALRPVAELDGNGNIVARFVYGTRVNVPEYMTKNNRTYRIITDHLGSTKMVVDVASGEIVQQMEYDEFGNVTSDTNSGFQPFGFAGGLYDSDTTLTRFGARDYDPHTGRWTDKDPIGFKGGNNHYAYVGNDVPNAYDPYGFWGITVGGSYGGFDVSASMYDSKYGLFPTDSPDIGVSTTLIGGGISINLGDSTLDESPGDILSTSYGIGKYLGVTQNMDLTKSSYNIGLSFGLPLSFSTSIGNFGKWLSGGCH